MYTYSIRHTVCMYHQSPTAHSPDALASGFRQTTVCSWPAQTTEHRMNEVCTQCLPLWSRQYRTFAQSWTSPVMSKPLATMHILMSTLQSAYLHLFTQFIHFPGLLISLLLHHLMHLNNHLQLLPQLFNISMCKLQCTHIYILHTVYTVSPRNAY